MIRRVKFRHKKPLNEPNRAAWCDAVMGRARDNPYRKGSVEWREYEWEYEYALIVIGEEEPDVDGPLSRGRQYRYPK